MTAITIRSARLEDLPVLYEFEQGIVDAERPLDPTLKRTPINYYDLKELILSEDAEVSVAVVDDQPIGSGYIQIKPAKPYLQFDTYGYIGFMFVDPAFRGRGVSGLLLNAFESWAKEKGLVEIRLEVYETNTQAVRSYKKAGFSSNLVEMRKEITGQ